MKKRTIEELTKRVEECVSPNTFIVLTIKQGICLENGAWIPPTEEVLDRVTTGFLKALSRELYGNHCYTRRMIKNLSTLEGRFDTDWHLNICLRRPDSVTIDEFREMVERAWARSRWSRSRIYVEDITGNAVRYIMKEGPDSILVKSSNF